MGRDTLVDQIAQAMARPFVRNSDVEPRLDSFLSSFASDGEGSCADPGSPPARQTAAGSQPLDGPDEPAKGYVDNSSIERCEACHRPLSASLPHQCPHEAGTQGDGPFAAEVALDDVLDRIGQDISRESAIHALDELRKDGWLLVRSAEAGTQEDEGLLRDVTGSAGYVDRANAMGEALSFLARFPREGDEG